MDNPLTGRCPVWTSSYSHLGGPCEFGYCEGTREVEVSHDGDRLFAAGFVAPYRASGQAARDSYGYDWTVSAHETSSGTAVWGLRIDGGPGLNDMVEDVEIAPDDERVYLAGFVNEDWRRNRASQSAVIALDAATGDEIWRRVSPDPRHPGDAAWSLAVSPDGEVLYESGVRGVSGDPEVWDWDAYVVARDADTGEEVWSASYAEQGSADETWYASAVSSDGSKLFVGGVGAGTYSYEMFTGAAVVAAYDTVTGRRVWTVRHDAEPERGDWVQHLRVDDGTVRFLAHVAAPGAGSGQMTVGAVTIETGALAAETVTLGPAASYWYDGTLSADGSRLYAYGWGVGDFGYDYVISAHDVTKASMLWQVFYGFPRHENEFPLDVALAPDERRLYVTGMSSRYIGAGIGGTERSDAATLALDSSTGETVWLARQNNSSTLRHYALGSALALEGDHLYVAAMFSCREWAVLGCDSLETYADVGLIKYDT